MKGERGEERTNGGRRREGKEEEGGWEVRDSLSTYAQTVDSFKQNQERGVMNLSMMCLLTAATHSLVWVQSSKSSGLCA